MKILLVLLAALAPISGLRRWILNRVADYDIERGACISFGTIIYVDRLVVQRGTKIGMMNIFKGPISVHIGQDSRIGRFNQFLCGRATTDERHAKMLYRRELRIGDKCLVLNSHYFDVYGLVELGNGTWVAGVGSQFWTHGISTMDRDIVIGEDNYIGSGVKFAPGSGIGNDNIVGLGSVISHRIGGHSMLIAGFPARGIKSIADLKAKGEYRFDFQDW